MLLLDDEHGCCYGCFVVSIKQLLRLLCTSTVYFWLSLLLQRVLLPGLCLASQPALAAAANFSATTTGAVTTTLLLVPFTGFRPAALQPEALSLQFVGGRGALSAKGTQSISASGFEAQAPLTTVHHKKMDNLGKLKFAITLILYAS